MKTQQTELQQFYAGQTIFITGATGFIGIVLLEKLLRSFTDICKIYILIRPKKEQSIESRLNELFENRLFDRVKREVQNFRHKVVPISGDLYNENLGLSEHDRNILMREVSIVFHVAGIVRFDEEIHQLITLNVYSIKKLLTLVKHMPKLQAFLYTSTLYSNSHLKNIDERFYPCPIDPDYLIKLLRNLSRKEFNEKISQFIAETQYTNSYTFSKAVAETLLFKKSENVPLGIFRPSIVAPTADEPFAGWTNSYGGLMLFSLFIQSGIMRVVLCNSNARAQIVPVDITVNALIASAWDVHNHFRECKNNFKLKIYNCIISADGIKWRKFFNSITTSSTVYPSNDILWEPMTFLISQKIIYQIYILFCHLLPAILLNILGIVTGHRPRMLKVYQKTHTVMKILSPFTLNDWICSNRNVQMMWNRLSTQDQQLFDFNMKNFDWETYFHNFCKSVRLDLLKQNDSTLESARIKRKRLYWMHQIFKGIFIFSSFLLGWYMVV
ncbi:putative fatty acyl-CoA reductase CG5065 isoform X1 [Pseudomyrmex gracilis]|uniref:putative fatty acyl-CoA reductase CG5065 isoform X1 n=1 Tax=Pseudomyrmex gracilis TaxID=219809 RepID=UPI000994E4D5|nr:putative fatty acyl-CoA reductase CG5065 isoform X1 [Pseudomyrmex gracilis]